MNKKTALAILKSRDPSQLTDEAAILILLMKYKGELSRNSINLLWDYGMGCPFCELHGETIQEHCLTGALPCPWVRFHPIKYGKYKIGRYSCEAWSHSEIKTNIKQLGAHPEALAKRIAMLKDWLKRVRKGE